MKLHVEVSSTVPRSPRVMQIEGLFDLPPGAERPKQTWDVDLPIEHIDWSVGLIVGPSGCGKSTIARQAWAAELQRYEELRSAWNPTRSLLDDFPPSMGIKDITELLSAVGFSSPPSWVKPFHVLSNGEQFRVMVARALAEAKAAGTIAVIDEFTSVVDRTVARIGSYAAAKAARRQGIKLVAITCHNDVEEWLTPDWIYRPAELRWERGSVQRRPPVKLSIHRAPISAWRYFAHHHYLTAEIARSAWCWVAFADLGDGPRLAAFHASMPFVGRLKDGRLGRRGHRTVCLPDFQGLGIGNALACTVATMWKGLGYRAFSNTGHPAEIHNRLKTIDKVTGKPAWQVNHLPKLHAKGKHLVDIARASNRKVATFEWVGHGMPKAEAEAMFDRSWVQL